MATADILEMQNALAGFTEIERDIVLHLIAAHHGRARPHFSDKEIFDYNCGPDESLELAETVPHRFGRLQQRFGRWGLVWLESILRSADYAASAGIVAGKPSISAVPEAVMQEKGSHARDKSEAPMSLRVDVTNSGQYFACCGLFELADKLRPGMLAHFEQDSVTKQWRFILSQRNCKQNGSKLSLSSLFETIVAAEILAIDPDDAPKTALNIRGPFNLIVDWWRYECRNIGKLKTWAGQMSVCSIANDMKQALKKELINKKDNIENILFVTSMANSSQPYYFDANYAINAQVQDVGFSIDKLNKGGFNLKAVTVPAVEFLCLIGLQRARPVLLSNNKGEERLYEYVVWNKPQLITIVPAIIAGVMTGKHQHLRFANPSRAKDYRAFMPAVLI